MNESEALRWVARQWQRLNGKDEISGVGGMLREISDFPITVQRHIVSIEYLFNTYEFMTLN